MRILIVHNKYQQAGGEDMVFEAESRLLRERGHDVEQLVFENDDLRSTHKRLLAAFTLLYNPQSAAFFKKKVQMFHPDVIHVHNFFPLASPSIFFVARALRIPVVLTLHNYRLICPGGILFYDGKIYERSLRSVFPLDAVLKGVYRHSRLLTAASAVCFSMHNLLGTWKSKINRFIVLSEFARDKMSSSRLRIDANRLMVKPNFVFDNDYTETERNSSYLFVGRLSVEKGVPAMLCAAKEHGFNLVIVGDGDLRSLVAQYASECSNITYLGYLDRASVLGQMRSCRALIFPSVWYEGFPVTILEAYSNGTPVIGSRIGTVAEVVEDGVTGLLFNPGDHRDLAEKIAVMDSDPSFCAALGLNARKTYLNKYTPGRNYDMLMSVYNKAILEMKPGLKFERSEDSSLKVIESQKPVLTIGIPTYNGAARIQKALDSVFAENFKDLEVIISDNASTDNTQQVCTRNIASHPEISYYRRAVNIGLVPNFDFVLSRAKGKFFMWLSDDDVLEPGILNKCVSFLEDHGDFALASGQIVYWQGTRLDYIEQGFNLTSTSPALRLIQYYNKTLYGGMFHGVMRREVARRIPARNVFGNDFHFVASLAYLGKIRNFDFPGYHKSLGGCSRDVHQCARAMGESALASRFPHFKIALDAMRDVMYRSPVFAMSFPGRLGVGISCFLASAAGYYGRIVPLSLAGMVKRWVFNTLSIRQSESYFKRASYANHEIKTVRK